MRVRIHEPRRHPTLLHTLQQRLEATDGAQSIRVDPRTGSVLVQFDPHVQTCTGLVAILDDIGVEVVETARAGDRTPDDHASGQSRASARLARAVSDLDRHISELTRRKVDLKLLFPMALGGIGVWQLARRGTGLADVPAYVVLWYAFDSFWKFHHMPASPPEDGAGI